MPNLADQIRVDLQTALDQDELALPSLPEVALGIRDEAQSSSVSANSLARVISADAGLAAGLIRVANSAAFRGTRVIDELPVAINRIGLENAANLATGLAMEHMFQATSDLVDRQLRDTWKTSTEVATFSGAIARNQTGLRVDQAILAGLTHRIGVLPILAWAEENDTLLRDSITLQRVIDSIHGSIGTMILQRWDFPDDVALVPAQHTDYTRHSDTPDFISVVTVAVLEVQRSQGRLEDPTTLADVSAYACLEIDPESEEFMEFLEGIHGNDAG